MKYHVHLYTVVRVKMPEIEADSPLEAIERAEDNFLHCDPNYLIPAKIKAGHAEYAEEIINVLVDVDGDDEYEQTELYEFGKDGNWHATKAT